MKLHKLDKKNPEATGLNKRKFRTACGHYVTGYQIAPVPDLNGEPGLKDKCKRCFPEGA